jgi:hypothetical protein
VTYIREMRLSFLVLLAGLALALTAGLSAAAPAPVPCGSAHSGPGPAPKASSKVAACILYSYQHCRHSGYSFSAAAVDTAAVWQFEVYNTKSGCRVAFTRAFHVIPSGPRHVSNGSCKAIVRRGPRVFALGCTGQGNVFLP